MFSFIFSHMSLMYGNLEFSQHSILLWRHTKSYIDKMVIRMLFYEGPNCFTQWPKYLAILAAENVEKSLQQWKGVAYTYNTLHVYNIYLYIIPVPSQTWKY
jgi:hypothetical protein